MKKIHFITVVVAIMVNLAFAQTPRWHLAGERSIEWQTKGSKLPHADNIEMSGRRVSGIVFYELDTARQVKIRRQIFFPQLRTVAKTTDNKWFAYRNYLQETVGDDVLPHIYLNEKEVVLPPVEKIRLDGTLRIFHEKTADGLTIERHFLPSADERLFIETWQLTNTSSASVRLKIAARETRHERLCFDGGAVVQSFCVAPSEPEIAPGGSVRFGIFITAKSAGEDAPKADFEKTSRARTQFLAEMAHNLRIETPEPSMDALFYFSKIRAAESLFESPMGLVHSPGGGRYYMGFWANDQAEYAAPFFPYLGYAAANEASRNVFRAFSGETNADVKPIRYAFEMGGQVPGIMLDRGDAAMLAFGAAQFALASGSRETADSLWHLIEWSLEYCHRNRNEAGAVKSESDEMEGRIATGTANLSTSCLYFGALNEAAILAKNLKKSQKTIEIYQKRAAEMRQVIETYFGAEVEGLPTYKYYAEHRRLRHWICLPLVMGIGNRRAATVTALLDSLWTDNGVLVERNADNPEIGKIFWDRATLYAFRGIFKTGDADRAMPRFRQFVASRLLGERVPYMVEAFPEGNMAHLSAESVLFCRIFTEGILGIEAAGFRSFSMRPQLPSDWPFFRMKNVRAFGSVFDISIERADKKLLVEVRQNGQSDPVFSKKITAGEAVLVELKP